MQAGEHGDILYGEFAICTTGLVFSNAYYVLRNLGTHKKVVEKLAQLERLIDIIDVRIIITRNTKDYKYSELAVLTPDQYLKGRS